jgi:quinol monooxygenase YgiN
MVRVGLSVRLHARSGKEAEVAKFLEGALPAAQGESRTPVWFALQLGPRDFGIFDVFADDAGRQAHLTGPIAKALLARAEELFDQPPRIEPVDVLAAKVSA